MRNFLMTSCLIGAMTGILLAQEPTPPPAPPPGAGDSTNHPHSKPPMTEEQRAQMEQRLNDAWARMPVEAKSRLMRLNRALSEMPPEERKFVHDRIERFLGEPKHSVETLDLVRALDPPRLCERSRRGHCLVPGKPFDETLPSGRLINPSAASTTPSTIAK